MSAADLYLAEPEPPTLLELLHRSIGLAELHGVIANYRDTETIEEEDRGR